MNSKDETLAITTIRGTFWNYGSYMSGRLVAFVSMLVLARLLSKDDFGVAAYAGVATGFIDVVAGLGISNAVIYYKDQEGIFDTAFWLNMISSFVIFTIAWFGAPLLGIFFNDTRATPVMEVLAFTYPLAAIGYIHGALLQKQLAFGKRFIPSLAGAISKALISIPMAYLGYGYWSIVFGQLGSQFVTTIAYWIVLPWRPTFRFKRPFVRPLMTYGLTMVLSDALSSIVNQIDYLLIGRNLGSIALGIYSMAFRLPEIVIQMFCSAIANVLFPIFASLQDDLESLRRGFLTTTQYMFLIVAPIGVGLALVAEPFILVFLSDKWLEAIPVIRAISIFSTIQAIPYTAGIVYKARGRQNILTLITVVQFCLVAPSIYWVTIRFGSIEYVAWTQVAISLFITVLSLGIAVKIINASFLDIFKSLIPGFISGVCLAITVTGVLFLTHAMTPTIQLLLSLIAGVVSYIGAIYLVKKELIFQMLAILGLRIPG
ncbi:MAG: lipopolysaccharide biosynthesis protein [Anaerolineaceae bacterium]